MIVERKLGPPPAAKLAPTNAHPSGAHSVAAGHAFPVPPGNRLEALRGNRKGQHSIRINDQFRLHFRWSGTDAADVEIVDDH